MDDAALDLRFREHGVDDLPETRNTVHTKQVIRQHPTVFQVLEHAGSKLGAFVLTDPDAQNGLASVPVDGQHYVGCFYNVLKERKEFMHQK